ncbi:MAG: cytochrome c family protein [Gammaproteobacteria bacterium]|nr:cytochrome c family protein [Gammaproteobacteria bacterium]
MNLFKKIVFKLYVIFLMVFTVWYGHFMYPLIFGFEGKEMAAESLKDLGEAGTDHEKMFVKLISEHGKKSVTDLGYKVIDQPYIEGRFHHIGFPIEPDKASLCVSCHGNVPHDNSKEVRSFLNMHAFYVGCETCHIQPKEAGESWRFRWYSKENGDIIDNPVALVEIEDSYKEDAAHNYPTYGKYGAKIAPVIQKGSELVLLSGEKEKKFAQRYVTELGNLNSEQKSQIKKVIHQKVSKTPLQCDGCHQEKDPYIPYAALGYPPRRVVELTNTSVVGMIEKYKEFYIPSFLSPGVGNE